MKAVKYARYSSDKQDADSIEAQLRACDAYAAAKGFTVVGQYVDEAISGKGSKTASRTQYQKMLRDCEKGLFDVILVHKYDRIARNIGEHVNLEYRLKDKGITLIAVAQDFGSSNEAKIMRTLVWAMSEYYIDNLSGEVKKGHKETALKGLHNGGVPPFGYDVTPDQEYIINELEAAYVRKIYAAALNCEGLKGLIAEMAACGIVGKRGKPIRYSQVYEILRNEKYTGVYLYSEKQEKKREDVRVKPNAIRVEGGMPAIIDRATFEGVQSVMQNRKMVGRISNHLCRGLVYCVCGAKMHGLVSKRRGHEYHYFYCSKKCGFGTVNMDVVDSAARDYLNELLSIENQVEIAAAMRKYSVEEKGRIKEFNDAIKRQIGEKERQYEHLMNSLSTGALPPDVVADIGKRMQSIKDEIAALRVAEPPRDFTTDQITTWLDAVKSASDEKAIHLFIERIDVINKTDFNMTSTLKSVLGNLGSGGRIRTNDTPGMNRML